jgi:hypothetical protein
MRQPRQRSPVVHKIGIALLTGGAVFVLTFLANQSKVWDLSASAFVGGVVLVAEFLNDFERRLKRVEESQEKKLDELRRWIEDGFARLNEATEMFQAIEASAFQTEAITQLIRNSTQIRTDWPPQLLYRYVQSEINQMSQFLKDISERGEISYEGEDRDWLLGLTVQCQHTMNAISLSPTDSYGVDSGLWNSDLGQRYLALQMDATRRGVVIRRLFVIDTSGPVNQDKLLSICRQHKDIGIHIKVLDQSTMPELIKNMLVNFVVFDSVVSYETAPVSFAPSASRLTILTTRLVLQPERVQERMQRFEDLWSAAKEVD